MSEGWKRQRAAMGEPHFQLGPLSLWVHRYQFPEATDYWDANWLVVTAEVSVPGQSWVRVNGPFLMTTELFGLRNELEALRLSVKGGATLDTIEPELHVALKGNYLGQISCVIEITPDNSNQEHCFLCEVDQSHLSKMITALADILDRFPMRIALEGEHS